MSELPTSERKWEARVSARLKAQLAEVRAENDTLRQQVSDAEWDWKQANVFKNVDPWKQIHAAREASKETGT